MTPWLYNNEEVTIIPENMVGFVYCITQISTGKMYVGKKKLWFKKTSLKTVIVKSTGVKKKKKIRSLIPSDWATYYGSSTSLLNEIEKCGKDDFRREILVFCETESMLTYQESKEQFMSDCLLKPNEYFNEWIMCRVRRSNLMK